MSTKTGENDAGAEAGLPFTFTLKDGRTCTFRRPTDADAEELCGFVAQVDAETDFLNRFPGEFDKTVEQEREFIREYSDDQEAVFFVAEAEGRLIGSAGARRLKLKRFRHHAELGLSVFKAFWGLGIGRKMMDCTLAWGKRRGLRKMYLKVAAHNERAIALYRSLGFEEESRLREYVLRADGTYGDMIIMARLYV